MLWFSQIGFVIHYIPFNSKQAYRANYKDILVYVPLIIRYELHFCHDWTGRAIAWSPRPPDSVTGIVVEIFKIVCGFISSG
jgi:hypothetical protein